mgnify:FL=1
MLFMKDDFNVTTKTIQGVQYVVFSIYDNQDTIYEKVGKQIENSFEKSFEPSMDMKREL